MSIPCTKEDAIEQIKEDVKEIKHDVRSLLEFKWKLSGIAIAAGAIVGILVKVIGN